MLNRTLCPEVYSQRTTSCLATGFNLKDSTFHLIDLAQYWLSSEQFTVCFGAQRQGRHWLPTTTLPASIGWTLELLDARPWTAELKTQFEVRALLSVLVWKADFL